MALKKPKLAKLPKKPKSKTVQSMENYLKRVAEVRMKNRKLQSDYNKKVKKIDALKNKISKITSDKV